MNKKMLLSIAGFLFTLSSASLHADLTFNMTTIGNPGNEPDHPGLMPSVEIGAVSYVYQITTYEVTVGQYVQFLNAKASSDSYGLYDSYMSDPLCIGGAIIDRNGESGSYTYSAVSGKENQPVRYVNFYDGLRLANWLNNGQGDGDTEDGAYTLSDGAWVERNAGATWALVSKDEWHKAAYYDPDTETYWEYPNGKDTVEMPTDQTTPREMNIGDLPFWGGNVFFTSTGQTTGCSAYGVYDLGGNIEDWTDSLVPPGEGHYRVSCGSSYKADPEDIARAGAVPRDPAIASSAQGLRLVYLIPEPATIGLALFGLFSVWFYRRRRVR